MMGTQVASNSLHLEPDNVYSYILLLRKILYEQKGELNCLHIFNSLKRCHRALPGRLLQNSHKQCMSNSKLHILFNRAIQLYNFWQSKSLRHCVLLLFNFNFSTKNFDHFFVRFFCFVFLYIVMESNSSVTCHIVKIFKFRFGSPSIPPGHMIFSYIPFY